MDKKFQAQENKLNWNKNHKRVSVQAIKTEFCQENRVKFKNWGLYLTSVRWSGWRAERSNRGFPKPKTEQIDKCAPPPEDISQNDNEVYMENYSSA